MSSVKKTPSKASVLKEDLHGMESQLALLRRQMQEERAKREGIMAAGNGNSLWNNGGQGLLRTNFRSKSGDKTSTTKGPCLPQTTPNRAPGEQDVVFINKDRGASAPRMAQAPLNDRGLAVGAFDEADSHQSFLEALNEWRNGGTGLADKAKVAPPAASRPPRAASAASAMEVQTDNRSLSASAQSQLPAKGSKTFFDKLALVSASKEAGESAVGASSSSSIGPQRLESISSTHDEEEREVVSPEEMERELMAKKMAILLQLEQLELAQRDEEEEDDGYVAKVVEGSSMGLVKGDRLPDHLVVPKSEGED